MILFLNRSSILYAYHSNNNYYYALHYLSNSLNIHQFIAIIHLTNMSITLHDRIG